MSDTVIKVESVSKKYCKTIKHTMMYGAADIAKSFFNVNSNTEELRDGEFWAVDNISFELKRGETLGIIGPNGSGKSTLLKMLNGIFMPDKGRIEIKGRVGALIEVGAGFHPMLTGRENIYINGSIMGMGKKELNRKFDEIVEFADIGDFIDSPVKHYSSGMHVRLGFAVAVHCEPDILLVDEILSVGDLNFRQKCYKKISDLISKNLSLIIISHSMYAIKTMANNVFYLNKGKNKGFGKPDEIIETYQHEESKRSVLIKNTDNIDSNIDSDFMEIAKINYFSRNNNKDNKYNNFFSDTPITIRINFVCKNNIPDALITLAIIRSDSILCCNTQIKLCDTNINTIEKGKKFADFNFGNIQLNAGAYTIQATFQEPHNCFIYSQYLEKEPLIIRSKIDLISPNSYPIFTPFFNCNIQKTH